MSLDFIFEQVRLELYVPFKKPLVYDGNKGPVKAWNSGGRSLIVKTGDAFYRVKGVDPDGLLTTEVAKSKKNKIPDVASATRDISKGVYWTGEPFGVLTPQKAANEQKALSILNAKYREAGIKPPYEFKETVPIRGGVQNWFRIARPADDLRVEELDMLLIEKFSKLDKKELEDRYKDVIKLYARFNNWAGLGARLMAESKLKPAASSFLPQNYVISAVDSGYGVFRVDHTSTQHLPELSEGQIFDGLQKEMKNMEMGFVEDTLLKLPTAMLIVLDPDIIVTNKEFIEYGRKKGLPDLQIAYYYKGLLKSGFYGYYLNVMHYAFIMGFGKVKEPIDEKYFRNVLE